MIDEDGNLTFLKGMCEANGAMTLNVPSGQLICAPARFAKLLAHAQNITMCLSHMFEFLVSELEMGLSEMVETRGLNHIRATENAAKMAESESK